MGLNVLGFATSIKTDNLRVISDKIDIQVSEKIGLCTLEEALYNIKADEICIIKTENGSIILVGDEFPILETRLRPLSEDKNKVLRFMYGETSMVFLFEYHENNESLRLKSVFNDEVHKEEGKTLDIEYSGIETDEVIMNLMLQVSGDNIETLELNQEVVRYRYLGKPENIDSSSRDIDKGDVKKQFVKAKPWWKFW